ncbi:filamentous haemagglutinin family protein [Methylobacter psychrophilus]|uniref:filamentous haemagglutinin family protein n=1 Tax=Methylobacter psychrophilus TaxID=96941 RepID=UPI0021D4B43C|nr:filamentous haemagglutinin family protein [Methylobacter psychrophilus]
MSHKTQLISSKPVENLFRLKPLVAYMRVVIAGGLFAGVVVPTHAELPVPVAAGGFVSSGSATNTIIGDTLRIDQQSDKAILNWQSFNVGKENTVQFVQPGSSSIALNRINQADPSQIFGQIIANGQVYLYNQNGFVFGKDSVVNTNSLLASTLNITDEAFNQGLTRVFDDNNGAAALAIEPMKSGATMDPKTARILIEAGAKIHTDKSGRIIIVAPTIENKGSLSSDNQGQIILAASQDKVYLQAASPTSPFAGLVVEVDTGGTVTNAGDILAKQGNITMAGFAVNQQGRVSATTSVSVNGSIRLLAQEQHGKLGEQLVATSTTRATAMDDGLGTKAKVTFSPGSVTQVIADADGGTAIDEQLQPESYMQVSANTVHLKSGSSIKVTGGKVDITATDNLANATLGQSGQIHVENGARIDVSGTKGVVARMERNVAQISVQSFELRDAPLQRTGVLKGETINVDLRKPTSIVDISGALARITRGIDERLGVGGQINFTASGDVIINDGANVDISGGSVIYQDGYINTTKLMNDFGRIVDISAADPNQHYQAIFGVVTENHLKWGVTTVYNILDQFGPGVFQNGYVEGKDAGNFTIKAPLVAWNGNLVAGSVTDIYQRDISTAPFGGQFSVDTAVFNSLQNIRFQTEGNSLQIALDSAFPKDGDKKPVDMIIAADLFSHSGVQEVSVKTLGNVTLAEGVNIAMQPTGSLSVEAGNINIDGSFKAASGTINLKAATNSVSTIAGFLEIGKQAVLDVSGLWVNDFQKGLSASPTDLLAIAGGTVKLQADEHLLVNAGSAIHADGGAWQPLSRKLQAGKGGDITLAAVGTNAIPSTLTLAGNLSAYGLEQNGSLTLASGRIIVGKLNAAEVEANAIDQALVLGVSNDNFDFSQQLAFSKIDLLANFADLTVKSGVHLDLKAKNLEIEPGFLAKITGSSLRDFTKIVELPEHLRNPLQLTLDGNTGVTVEAGSHVMLDKGSVMTIQSSIGSIFVDGQLQADAGQIKLAILPLAGLEYDAKQTIWLGEHAKILAQGATRMNIPDILGRRTGEVLNGGEISFDAQRGAVVLTEGSLLDVSGTSGQLDILQSTKNVGVNYAEQIIASDAGKIQLTAAEGIVLDGTLRGIGGSSTTHGGGLEITLDRSKRNPPDVPKIPFPDDALIINVNQFRNRSLGKDLGFGDDFSGVLNGQATLSADKVMAGGFADLRLSTKDEVVFVGDVNLTTTERINIDARIISAAGVDGADAGKVVLKTDLLTIGSSLNRSIADSAAVGKGLLTASAQWIQLSGATQWNGFSRIALNSEHDLRTIGLRNDDNQRDFVGALVTAADLHLQASQIYPSTLTDFTFVVKNNPDGKISITGRNTDVSPLSAGGKLTFEAAVINQQGVLKAPLGTITLKADKSLTLDEGSLTSVSAKNQIIPFGVTQGGLDWLYPLDSLRNLVFDSAPEKRLVLSAPAMTLAKGSVVDVTGGGDLSAYEFLPGAGGSYDYLQSGSASNQGGFAILPALGSQLAPYDHYESQGFSYAPGSTVYLSGSSVLPAGEYAILPAHYALMPGAFLITPQANSQDIAINQYTIDGRTIVPGYQKLAGSSVVDARSNGYRIESGADVRIRSKYDAVTANQFYQDRATKNSTDVPLLPIDSGQITLIAQTRLIMDGQFMVDAVSGGRGARMDIAANKINVVNQLSAAPVAGTLEILADNLSGLKIDSLLLGGSRSRNASSNATDVNVTAEEVIFSANSKLFVSDLIVAAAHKIEVQNGAELTANGKINSGDSILNVSGDGALLRLSGDKQVILNRTNTPGDNGKLIVAAGSKLTASESMLLDASQSTSLEGDVFMNGGSLNLSANAINMGEVAGLTLNALNLTDQKLLNLSVDELILNSRGTVGFYGNVGQVDAPIKFDRLVINAAGFSGFGSSDQAVRLEANDLVLANPLGAIATTTGTGLGSLDLLATNFTQGAGTFAVKGFNAVNINVNNKFIVDGKSALNVAADLNLNAGYLTATGGSSFKLDASGHALNINGNEGAISAVSPGFGGAMEFVADTIAFDANTLLASGRLNLQALIGDVFVGSAANIDLAGRAVTFADIADYTPGGTFTAIADKGAITLASGSKLDISTGGGSAAGGNLVLKAPKQAVTLAGQIKATASSAEIDVSAFSGSSNFDSLMAVLNNAGIDNTIYFRSRDANIVQAANNIINANNVTLVADKGAVNIFGQLHADGVDQGGKINIYAGDKVTLEAGGQLTAIGAKGGKVLLSSVDDDSDGISGIALKDGSMIDVSGTEAGGDVTLRALRTATGINVEPVSAGVVKGAARFYAEGVKKYTNADLGNDSQINTADITKIKTQTANYMTSTTMTNVANLAPGMRLTAGVEVDYNGNLTLKDNWDLVTWRYGDIADSNVWNDLPGRLVIKTSGDFKVDKSLTDGFKTESFGGVNIIDKLQGGESWSYNLVAGADVKSADINAAAQTGNLVIASNTVIRTGSGDMQLTAGGDINFTDGSSSVYNAGHPTETSPYGSLKDRFVALTFYSEYPVEGGDLAIVAGGNINGAATTTNDFNDWLFRIGSWAATDDHSGQRPTAWGIALGYSPAFSSLNPARSSQPFFKQNVGSFGGGAVMVSAGGNISNLDVMMPTTGKQTGEADNSTTNSFDFLTNQVEVNGGGAMQISAGGDIAGGTYYLGKGNGTMTAGGQVTGGSVFTKGPEFLIGDTKFSVNAGSGASITGVSDPMIEHKADVNFFSYSAASAINIGSLSGDIILSSDGSIFPRSNTNSNQQTLARIYPASLHSTAFGGSIELTDEIILFPGANAELSLLAEQNITADLGIRLGMSDGDRTLLPYPESPLSRNNMSAVIGRIDPFGGDSKLLHAAVPIHSGDNQPVRLVTRQGDIENIGFNLAKKALIKSGHDIVNLSLAIQHVNEGDVTLLEATRDLLDTSDRDPATGGLLGNSAKIEVGGPGEVLVKTGRNIDLGASGGISTLGNVVNTVLPGQGANLTILAGANGELDYSGFIATYLQGNDKYTPALTQVTLLITDFMRSRMNDSALSDSDALEAFAELNSSDFMAIQTQINAIILPVFFNEIKESGTASAGTGLLGNKPGFAVIDKLFPGSAWKGDVNMFFSKINTIDNGNINLVVPGGMVNAGLAVSFTGAKPASELGIVAQREGNINAMVHNDFTVNTSRVFALDGGDIMIWSSAGNIDAGRGAKSAIAAPPPIVSFDQNGNMKITFPPIVSGSGIRTAASSIGVEPGDVYLFAPTGVVDAGEAGIGGKNVFIAATAVLGANNIQVSGVGTGVPVASTGSIAAGMTGTSNMTASVSQVAQAVTGMDDGGAETNKNAALGMFSVEVLGFGD